jgi:transposase-like protein
MAIPHSDQTKARALKLYVSGKTGNEISIALGVAENTIHTWVRTAGLARKRGGARKRVSPELRAAVMADLAETGDPVQRVARRHNIAVTALRQWVEAEREFAYRGEWVRVGAILRGSARDVA